MDGPEDRPCGDVRVADVRIVDGTIESIGLLAPRRGDVVRDASGLTMVPGFVQGHVHLCQTLFRGLADDRPLLRWLRECIWPLEARHDSESIRVSAELTVAELLRGGTTAVQAFETVRHTEVAAEVLADSGMAATFGNCLMDLSGDGVPASLAMPRDEALRHCDELRRAFHDRGRLRYAITPRFVLSCSEPLAREAADFARDHGLRVHTHACEHREEVAVVRARFGHDYLTVLDAQGLLGPHASLAHCVHLTEAELDLLAMCGAAVLHCPSANLKLGSGVAEITRLRELGVPVALGADGAPCNNRLSALTELRQAALLQCLAAEPGAWSAAEALWTATRGGALAIGLDDCGVLRAGASADFVLFDLEAPELGAHDDVIAKLVWSAAERHIRHVVVGGRRAVVDGELVGVDLRALAARARDALRRLR